MLCFMACNFFVRFIKDLHKLSDCLNYFVSLYLAYLLPVCKYHVIVLCNCHAVSFR
jgi:hypothetical protein